VSLQLTFNKLQRHAAHRTSTLRSAMRVPCLAQLRALLTVLIEKFGGGPVGLNTLSAALSEEEATIEEVHEPYLLQLGFLERTPRGRTATSKAYIHLKLRGPEKLL